MKDSVYTFKIWFELGHFLTDDIWCNVNEGRCLLWFRLNLHWHIFLLLNVLWHNVVRIPQAAEYYMWTQNVKVVTSWKLDDDICWWRKVFFMDKKMPSGKFLENLHRLITSIGLESNLIFISFFTLISVLC